MSNTSVSIFKRSIIALGVAAALTPAAQAARVEGRVSDTTETIFINSAIVRIPELNMQVRSGRDGRFSFANVPAGTYTIRVSFVGAEPVEKQLVVNDDTVTMNLTIGDDVDRIENVIVYGQTGRAANAINRQRAADNVISVISSDSAGALPDNNIAEALQRAPGVSLERDQGEGRYVGIRGLSPSLNTVQVNGVNLPSPDAGQRAVALDVIPSDMLETLEVTKTFTPEQDGDAIGGTVNIKSLTAFDREGQYWKLNAEAGYNDLVEETSPKVSAVFSDTFSFGGEQDNLGVAVALSYEDREFGSDNLEHDGGWVQEGDFFWPEEPEHRDYQVERERFGATVNFDYRASDTSSYYLRTLYSDFEDDEIRNRIEVKGDEDALVNLEATSGGFSEVEHVRSLKDRKETQEIISLVLGGTNELQRWTFDYALGYSYAEEDEPDRIDTDFAGDDWPFSWVRLGDTPKYNFEDITYQPEGYEIDEMVVENNTVEDTEYSFKFDATHYLDFGDNPAEIKMGVKLRTREKERESTIDVFDDFDSVGSPDASAFAGGNIDYNLNRFGFGLNRGALRSFWKTLGDDNYNADESFTESTVGDYEIDEDIYAGYIQAQVDIDRLRLIGGVRYEYTENEMDGFIGTVYESETLDLEDAGFSNSSLDGDYDYLLPSLVFRYELTEDIILRGGASQTLARPSFASLNPSSLAEIEEEDGETEFAIEELGNPDLDPYESINLDFSAEWYPGDIGILSAAVFYKDVDKFIVQANVSDSLDLTPWLDLVGLTEADITDVDALQFQNGDDAELLGLELSYLKYFDNGLMVGLNGTFTDSDADFQGRSIDLPESAEQIYNLTLGYENHGIEARIAYNYTDERLIVVGGEGGSDVYQDSHSQIDASVAYNVTDSIKIYAEAINLTDEPYYSYQGSGRYNWQYEEYGLTYVVGVTVTNF